MVSKKSVEYCGLNPFFIRSQGRTSWTKHEATVMGLNPFFIRSQGRTESERDTGLTSWVLIPSSSGLKAGPVPIV